MKFALGERKTLMTVLCGEHSLGPVKSSLLPTVIVPSTIVFVLPWLVPFKTVCQGSRSLVRRDPSVPRTGFFPSLGPPWRETLSFCQKHRSKWPPYHPFPDDVPLCLLQGKEVSFVPQLWCILVRKTEVCVAQRKKNKLNKNKLNFQWCIKYHLWGQAQLLIFWSWWIYYVSVFLGHTTCFNEEGFNTGFYEDRDGDDYLCVQRL